MFLLSFAYLPRLSIIDLGRARFCCLCRCFDLQSIFHFLPCKEDMKFEGIENILMAGVLHTSTIYSKILMRLPKLEICPNAQLSFYTCRD